MFLGEVVGSGQAMTARADNNHIILGLRMRTAPRFGPILVVAQGVSNKAEERMVFHKNVQKLKLKFNNFRY